MEGRHARQRFWGHAVDYPLMITVQVFPVSGWRRDDAHPAGTLMSAVRSRSGAAR
jgi:hypothetical protein